MLHKILRKVKWFFIYLGRDIKNVFKKNEKKTKVTSEESADDCMNYDEKKFTDFMASFSDVQSPKIKKATDGNLYLYLYKDPRKYFRIEIEGNNVTFLKVRKCPYKDEIKFCLSDEAINLLKSAH